MTLAEAARGGTVLALRDVAAGTVTYALSVADYPTSNYFVTLTTKDGTRTQWLVVK